MARTAFNTTIDDETIKTIGELAVGRSRGQVIDQAVRLLQEAEGGDRLAELVEGMTSVRATLGGMADEVSETLELVRSMPEPVIAGQVQGGDLSSIPGVVRGAQNLPRRESGNERAVRLEAERQGRARARSSIGDDPSFCVDGEYVQE